MRGFVCRIVLMIALVGATGAVAEEDTEKQLGTVVVTATRTEAPLESVTNSVSVVSEADISARQSTTVTDALRDVPGVDVSQSGSLGSTTSVFIRGANSDQALILFDGVEANSPNLGSFNFGNITTGNVGRIEVLRGAGGTLYGSEAIGGVVNVITRKGEGAPHITLSSGGGNIGTAAEQGALSGQTGMVAYTASLGYLTTAGFRPENDDFSDLTSSARIDVTPIEHGTLRGFWRSAHSSLGLADNDIGQGVRLLDPNARERDEFYLGKIEWEHAVFERLTYRVAGAYTRTVNVVSDPTNAQETAAGLGSSYFRVPNEIITGETQVNYAEGSAGLSTVGFEFKELTGTVKSIYKSSFGDSLTRFSHYRSNYAGYVQQQVFLLDNSLTGVAGFRVDGNEDFGSEVSASWSLGYLQDWGSDGRWTTHVKGGYAEGFKAPTFNQLYFPGFGNPDLDPEISSEYDAGLTQYLGFPWIAAEGAYFTRRTKNLIQSAQTAPLTFVTANAARADVSGPEATLSVGPLFGFSLRGTYAYLDWNIIERPGFTLLPAAKTLERRPHNRMATMVTYSRDDLVRAADHFVANVNVVFVGERHDLDPFTFQDVDDQASYTRTDLALRYDTRSPWQAAQRVGWFARVQNVFDRNYDEVRGLKSPPINVLAGAEVTF
jgi:vitamin B12 transporter